MYIDYLCAEEVVSPALWEKMLDFAMAKQKILRRKLGTWTCPLVKIAIFDILYAVLGSQIRLMHIVY